MSNENKTFQFKTNINCGGCVATLTPFLDAAEGIDQWDVDTANKDKILSVHSKELTEEAIIQIVQSAGYKIESIHQ